jgi:hypothetical protein
MDGGDKPQRVTRATEAAGSPSTSSGEPGQKLTIEYVALKAAPTARDVPYYSRRYELWPL